MASPLLPDIQTLIHATPPVETGPGMLETYLPKVHGYVKPVQEHWLYNRVTGYDTVNKTALFVGTFFATALFFKYSAPFKPIYTWKKVFQYTTATSLCLVGFHFLPVGEMIHTALGRKIDTTVFYFIPKDEDLKKPEVSCTRFHIRQIILKDKDFLAKAVTIEDTPPSKVKNTAITIAALVPFIPAAMLFQTALPYVGTVERVIHFMIGEHFFKNICNHAMGAFQTEFMSPKHPGTLFSLEDFFDLEKMDTRTQERYIPILKRNLKKKIEGIDFSNLEKYPLPPELEMSQDYILELKKLEARLPESFIDEILFLNHQIQENNEKRFYAKNLIERTNQLLSKLSKEEKKKLKKKLEPFTNKINKNENSTAAYYDAIIEDAHNIANLVNETKNLPVRRHQNSALTRDLEKIERLTFEANLLNQEITAEKEKKPEKPAKTTKEKILGQWPNLAKASILLLAALDQAEMLESFKLFTPKSSKIPRMRNWLYIGLAFALLALLQYSISQLIEKATKKEETT